MELVERPNLSPEDAEWSVFLIQQEVLCPKCSELFTSRVLLHFIASITIIILCVYLYVHQVSGRTEGLRSG
jgi:hypothetical protein